MFENMVTFTQLGHYGRLGNCLFQIASTVGIAIKNDLGYIFPRWEYDEFFQNGIPYYSGELSPYRTFAYDSSKYMDIALTPGQLWNLQGYFQSEKYFKHCENLIRSMFTLSPLNESGVNTCAIHVRRGDYLSYPNVFHILDMDYYTKCMKMFPKTTKFLIFSDDISWCKANFDQAKFNIKFMENNNPYVDLDYMVNCKNIIMSNSSYAWWAAWLNTNPNKKVIFPSLYTKTEDQSDLFVEGWIKV